MAVVRSLVVGVVVLCCAAAAAAQDRGLKIVVLEGENAVNIIQQKTAVAPLVEVRDRNNVPVPGAVVTFTLGGNNAAFAGGVQTLSVTTNAAGRAVAALNPLSSGGVQIQVQAAFQGQTAAATIAQTNVMTAAQAGAAAGAAAGATGGGMSATTIGIVAGAVGGGALAAGTALDVFGGSTVFSGEISGQVDQTQTSIVGGRSTSCTTSYAVSGTLTMTLDISGDNVTGEFEITGRRQRTSSTCPGNPPESGPDTADGPVSGTTSNITFSVSETSSNPVTSGSATVGTSTTTERATFTGALNGDTITGTLVTSLTTDGTATVDGVASTLHAESAGRMPVTLRKQG